MTDKPPVDHEAHIEHAFDALDPATEREVAPGLCASCKGGTYSRTNQLCDRCAIAYIRWSFKLLENSVTELQEDSGVRMSAADGHDARRVAEEIQEMFAVVEICEELQPDGSSTWTVLAHYRKEDPEDADDDA